MLNENHTQTRKSNIIIYYTSLFVHSNTFSRCYKHDQVPQVPIQSYRSCLHKCVQTMLVAAFAVGTRMIKNLKAVGVFDSFWVDDWHNGSLDVLHPSHQSAHRMNPDRKNLWHLCGISLNATEELETISKESDQRHRQRKRSCGDLACGMANQPILSS